MIGFIAGMEGSLRGMDEVFMWCNSHQPKSFNGNGRVEYMKYGFHAANQRRIRDIFICN